MGLFDQFIRLSAEVLRSFDHDPIARAAYLELCQRAEWKAPSRRQTKHGWIDLDLGQCCFGREELATRIGHSERKVRRSVDGLGRSGALAVETSKLGSIATIVGLKEKLLAERGQRPSECPSESPSDVHQTSTTKIRDPDTARASSSPVERSALPELPDPDQRPGGDHDRVREAPIASEPLRPITWQVRNEWWQCMLAAHARLRARGIGTSAPKLAPHPNETMLAACERFLRDGGYDAANIDAKMRHVVLVNEAEAARLGDLRYFKPAIIWDVSATNRFPRKVDTSLEEANAEPRAAQRSDHARGGAIGSASPRTDHGEEMRPAREVM